MSISFLHTTMIYHFLCFALLACSLVQAAPAHSPNDSDDSKSGQSKAILTFDENEGEGGNINENLEDLPVRSPSDNDDKENETNETQGFPSFPGNNIETTPKPHEQGFNQGGEDIYQGWQQENNQGGQQEYNQGGQEEYNQGGQDEHNQGGNYHEQPGTDVPHYGGYDNTNQQSGNEGGNQGQGGIFGILNKVGEAAKETIHENKEKIKEHVQSVFEAGRGVFEAGKQSFETGIKLGTTLPRFGAKVLDKVAHDGESEQSGGQASFNLF